MTWRELKKAIDAWVSPEFLDKPVMINAVDSQYQELCDMHLNIISDALEKNQPFLTACQYVRKP